MYSVINILKFRFRQEKNKNKKGLDQICNMALHSQEKLPVEKPRKALNHLRSFQGRRACSLYQTQSLLSPKPQLPHCEMVLETLNQLWPLAGSPTISLTILSLTQPLPQGLPVVSWTCQAYSCFMAFALVTLSAQKELSTDIYRLTLSFFSSLYSNGPSSGRLPKQHPSTSLLYVIFPIFLHSIYLYLTLFVFLFIVLAPH